MVYTAVEIVFFLIVAAVLGLVLGLLLRGKSIRERLESQWRRLLDDERSNHHQTQDQLKRVGAQNETLTEKAKGLQAKIEKLEGLPAENRKLQKQLEEVQGQLAKLAPLAGEHAQLSAEREELQAKLKALQMELSGLETVRGENAQLKAQIDAQQARADALGPLQDEIHGLREKLENTQAHVQELRPLQSENQQLRDTVESLRASLTEAEEARTSASTGASEQTPEAPPAAPQGAASAEDLQARVRRIAERTRGGEPAADDDLKQIRGVGPVIEKLLKEMGITGYRQIANFTNDDIDQVTSAMGSFRGRIQRDGWVEGAREQHRKKYGTSA